ncbi:hypothetical protein [Nocardia wallacei]|uniref:hypothetical protein n=1 Tax=Nocardia wallacei TaxID=480035 RepID=UPI0024579E0A|nr:hypothetical protein [Nocardia wallacei]
MFEDWIDPFDPPLRRVVDPPAPVLVDLATAIPTGNDRPFGRNRIAMRIKAGGLVVTGQTPGQLHAWARAADGTWLGLVEFVLTTGNQRGTLPVRQWCPAKALRPTWR